MLARSLGCIGLRRCTLWAWHEVCFDDFILDAHPFVSLMFYLICFSSSHNNTTFKTWVNVEKGHVSRKEKSERPRWFTRRRFKDCGNDENNDDDDDDDDDGMSTMDNNDYDDDDNYDDDDDDVMTINRPMTMMTTTTMTTTTMMYWQ